MHYLTQPSVGTTLGDLLLIHEETDRGQGTGCGSPLPVVSVQLGLMQVYEAQVEKAPAFNHRAP